MTQAASENTTVLPGAVPGSSLEKSSISSRRAVLAAGLVLSVAAAAPACVAAEPDAELIALADRVKQLRVAALEAAELCIEADERFQDMEPEKPRALIWRHDDRDLRVRHSEFESVDDAGARFRYCLMEDIERLRGGEFFDYDFIGTAEEAKRLYIPNAFEGRRNLPVANYEHFFERKPDEYRNRRAQELLAALDDYRAKYEAAEKESGLTAAEEDLCRIHQEQEDLCDRMLEMKPTSVRGIQALATALVSNCWQGDIEDLPNQTQEDQLITAIVRSLAAGALAA